MEVLAFFRGCSWVRSFSARTSRVGVWGLTATSICNQNSESATALHACDHCVIDSSKKLTSNRHWRIWPGNTMEVASDVQGTEPTRFFGLLHPGLCRISLNVVRTVLLHCVANSFSIPWFSVLVICRSNLNTALPICVLPRVEFLRRGSVQAIERSVDRSSDGSRERSRYREVHVRATERSSDRATERWKLIITRAPDVHLTRWLVGFATFFKTSRSNTIPTLNFEKNTIYRQHKFCVFFTSQDVQD